MPVAGLRSPTLLNQDLDIHQKYQQWMSLIQAFLGGLALGKVLSTVLIAAIFCVSCII